MIVTNPSIMTDAIFALYGGQTGTSTAAQRTAAYCIAESEAFNEIGTYLTPTTVTGTHQWPKATLTYKLPVDAVTSIVSLVAIHEAGCECSATTVELTGCAWITDSANGIIDIREIGNTVQASCASCNCSGGSGWPYQFRVVYVAGLPLEAAGDHRLLMGLTTFSDLALQQIIDPAGAEGGPGDAGVQSYTTQGYSEVRTKLRRTAAGSSARANYAAQQLRAFKSMGALRL